MGRVNFVTATSAEYNSSTKNEDTLYFITDTHEIYKGSNKFSGKTTLADLGITSTATEINYVDGVTSNIQTQLNNKAAKSHTHTISNVTNLQDELDNKVETLGDLGITATASELNYVDGVTSNIQTQLNGKAASSHNHSAANITSGTLSLDRLPSITDSKISSVSASKISGTISSSNLPSYVDDVLEYNGMSNFPDTGESGKIYVDTSTNKTYRWSGSSYVEISASLALGETSSTAYRGDRGKTAYDHATAKGSAFASGLYKITTNAQGHVTNATAVTKSDITALGIPAQDTNTTYSDMKGATASAAGTHGLVPAPASGASNRYLRSDGTWQVPPDTNTTYTLSSFGITATAAELNKLDGVTATSAELNYVDGVTSNIQTQLDNKAASSHNHSATNITSGTLAVARGGTGVTANPSMLVNLGSTTAASVFAASPRPGITGTLAASHGGTGQTSLQATRNAMGLGNTTGALPVSNGGTGVTSLEDLQASDTQYGFVKFASDEDFKAYMGIS